MARTKKGKRKASGKARRLPSPPASAASETSPSPPTTAEPAAATQTWAQIATTSLSKGNQGESSQKNPVRLDGEDKSSENKPVRLNDEDKSSGKKPAGQGDQDEPSGKRSVSLGDEQAGTQGGQWSTVVRKTASGNRSVSAELHTTAQEPPGRKPTPGFGRGRATSLYEFLMKRQCDTMQGKGAANTLQTAASNSSGSLQSSGTAIASSSKTSTTPRAPELGPAPVAPWYKPPTERGTSLLPSATPTALNPNQSKGEARVSSSKHSSKQIDDNRHKLGNVQLSSQCVEDSPPPTKSPSIAKMNATDIARDGDCHLATSTCPGAVPPKNEVSAADKPAKAPVNESVKATVNEPVQEPVEGGSATDANGESNKDKEAMIRFLKKEDEAKLFNDPVGWDILLTCKQSRWKLHRRILVRESKYLADRLPPPLPDGSPRFMSLDLHDPGQLGTALQFMYCGSYPGADLNPEQPLNAHCILHNVAHYIAGASIAYKNMMDYAIAHLDKATEVLEALVKFDSHIPAVIDFEAILRKSLTIMYEQPGQEGVEGLTPDNILYPLRLSMAKLADGTVVYCMFNPVFAARFDLLWRNIVPRMVYDNHVLAQRKLLKPLTTESQEELMQKAASRSDLAIGTV